MSISRQWVLSLSFLLRRLRKIFSASVKPRLSFLLARLGRNLANSSRLITLTSSGDLPYHRVSFAILVYHVLGFTFSFFQFYEPQSNRPFDQAERFSE